MLGSYPGGRWFKSISRNQIQVALAAHWYEEYLEDERPKAVYRVRVPGLT